MDIFISYRRDGAESLAHLLYTKLTNDGYTVFLDVESLRSGLFNKALYEQIDICNDFLLLLPPGGLDRCSDPNDWVRLEVERAIQKNKNVVPILMRNFVFPKVLPESLSQLPYYNGIKAEMDYFEAVLKKIRNLLISKTSTPHVGQEKQADTEFIELLKRLYSMTVDYREAIKNGDQNRINTSTTGLMDLLQSLYYFAEKNRIKNNEEATKALEIVSQFNRYVPLFNEFANSKYRMSVTAQEVARKAEIEFSLFVNLIVNAISEIPNV